MSAPNSLEERIQKLRDAYALNNIYQNEALQIIDALQAKLQPQPDTNCPVSV